MASISWDEGGCLVLITSLPQVLNDFEHLAGYLTTRGVFRALGYDYRCRDRQEAGACQPQRFGMNSKDKNVLSQREHLTCFCLSDTYAERVSFGICWGLQVQRKDSVKVHLVSDQPAPYSADVNAILSEARPVASTQLLDLIDLKKGNRARDRD